MANVTSQPTPCNGLREFLFFYPESKSHTPSTRLASAIATIALAILTAGLYLIVFAAVRIHDHLSRRTIVSSDAPLPQNLLPQTPIPDTQVQTKEIPTPPPATMLPKPSEVPVEEEIKGEEVKHPQIEPPARQRVLSQQLFLTESWEQYKAEHPERVLHPSEKIDLCATFGLFHADRSTSPASIIHIDGNYCNIFRELESLEFSYFHPKILKLPDRNAESFTELKTVLTQAFAAGKQLVTVRLSSSLHGVAAAFCRDGSFTIVDSFAADPVIDHQKLEGALNRAEILSDIKFRGEYMNTGIQKGGNYCEKFAALYCYQMAKEGDVRGYRQVNSAFLAGKLTSFESFREVLSTHKGESDRALNADKSATNRFIESWFCHIYGITAASFGDIQLSTFERDIFQYEATRVYYICDKTIYFAKDLDLTSNNYELIQKNAFKSRKEYVRKTLSELSADSNHFHLILKIDGRVRVCKLSKDLLSEFPPTSEFQQLSLH